MKKECVAFTLGLSLSLLAFTAGLAEPAAPVLDTGFQSVLRSGDAVRLRESLDRGTAPQARDEAGNPPLMLAAIYGSTDAMALLLERGADVNAANKAGATALLRAATDPDKVALLLARGANVKARSTLGNTALMLAARPAQSHRAVKLLLDAGADPNATNNWGATALMAAAAGGDAATVRLLLERGADPNAQPAVDHVGFILGGGRNALMWAAFRGDTTILKLLLDAGANPNIPGFLGSPLSQAAWGEHTAAARLLLERGANVNQPDPGTAYSPLHWAASTETGKADLVQLLLSKGADPNAGGGEEIDAFLGTAQTPLMLARRRGDSPVLAELVKAGATRATPDRALPMEKGMQAPDRIDAAFIRAAVERAVPPLLKTAIESRESFVTHASKQDCVSCHSQMLPLAAVASARKLGLNVDRAAETTVLEMLRANHRNSSEADWEALFHPEPVHSNGYLFLAFAAEEAPADETIRGAIHHLLTIQGKEGQWHNNLPRPPMQTGDVGATALAIYALRNYPLPGHEAEVKRRIDQARQWLWSAPADNTEARAYQLLGLAWAGEAATKLETLAHALAAQQQNDGGWAQLSGLKSDAYATGQTLYALRVAAGFRNSEPVIERGTRFLLSTQLEDGAWHVRRRAFPFQPTMHSGFPHGRDSWISASATSWAVLALTLPETPPAFALKN